MNNLESDRRDITKEIEQKFLKKECNDICGIYGFQNKLHPDKWYVGQSIKIFRRWGGYKSSGCPRQPKFDYALKKYGYEGFNRVILEKCERTRLNELEEKWTIELNSVKTGYNLICGNPMNNKSTRVKQLTIRLNRTRTEKELAHLSKLHALRMGATVSEEVREKISSSQKGVRIKERNPNYGKPRTAEVKEKISRANSGKKRDRLARQRMQFGKFIKKLELSHPQVFGWLNC